MILFQRSSSQLHPCLKFLSLYLIWLNRGHCTSCTECWRWLKKFRHTSINYEMTVSLVLMNTSFTVWFFSHFLLSTFNIQRSYSWNTLCLEREAFSGGSRQPHRFQILHLFQVVLVYHLKMIFCPIVINREEIFCQEARSFVCWTVFCVSSCVEKSTNHLHVVVFQIPVSYISQANQVFALYLLLHIARKCFEYCKSVNLFSACSECSYHCLSIGFVLCT